MEFDVNRVYTAVNADELKAGDLCFFADDLAFLKRAVDAGSQLFRLKEYWTMTLVTVFWTKAGLAICLHTKLMLKL